MKAVTKFTKPRSKEGTGKHKHDADKYKQSTALNCTFEEAMNVVSGNKKPLKGMIVAAQP